MGATPLTLQDESLVAGNVTGGGGKATRTKTYRHRAFGRKQIVNSFWVLTGNYHPLEFSGYKPRFECVHAGIATPL
jgi:hypothetical protein